MPSIVGAVNIENVGGGTFTVGDVLRISPEDNSEASGGEGAFNSGNFMFVSNKRSSTNINDPDLSDQFTITINPFV